MISLDFDGDGDVDLASTHRSSGSGNPLLRLLVNDGTGRFSSSTIATTYHGTKLASADFNRDGDVDLVSVNENDDNVTVFLGDGTGGFSALGSFVVGDNPTAVAVGDFDGANGPDLAVSFVGGTDGVSVLLNTGSGSFPSSQGFSVTSNGTPTDVVALTLDGDSALDLVTVNRLTGDVSVFIGAGDGTFASQTATTVGGIPVVLGKGDLNDDGALDLVVGHESPGGVSILWGDGGGGLSLDAGSPYATSLDVRSIRVGDIDFDNALDVIASASDLQDPSLDGAALVLRNALGPFGPVVSTTELADGVMGIGYSDTLSATGGAPGYLWSLVAGALPDGLSLDASTGTISGTPTFAALGTSYFTVRVRDQAFQTGRRPLAIFVGSPASVVLSKGSGPDISYDQTLAGYEADGTPIAELSFSTHSLNGYGARVASARFDEGALDSILAAPGPGENHPPAIRGYERDGTRISFIDYFAYGVLKYGASLAGGDIDDELYDEILTGPGPGGVFGPQVRGWSYDGLGFPSALNRVNFYAYATLRYGVNVSAGDMDGDDMEEIVSGAGPGAVFGPHVRGFNFDGGSSTTSIARLNFFSYSTLRFGVNVRTGQLRSDPRLELLTGPGPGLVFGAHLRGFDFGPAVSAINAVNAIVFSSQYGLNVSAADVDADGFDELLTGAGPDPSAAAELAPYDFDGAGLSRITGLDSVDPFPGLAYGLRTAGAPLGY